MKSIQTNNISNLLICFDESGKQSSNPIQLMGAFSIPYKIYKHPNNQLLHSLNQEYHFHWTQYGGDSKTRNGIEKLFELAIPLVEYMNFNFIRYSTSTLKTQARVFTNIYESRQEIVSNTIYSKLPERICYGLLRGYGNNNHIQATILIEDATEYRARKLHETIKDSLNIHSLYRDEAFVILDCDYRSKGQEIGIEFIDILLGIVGTILNNPSPASNKGKAKVDIILKLLKENKLTPFLKNLKLFELEKSNQLLEANIEASVKLFIAKNYDTYMSL